jgi:hypothetical protein
MNKLTQHPEVIAEELRNNPQLSKEAEDSAAMATDRVVCLSYRGNRCFRLSWKADSPGYYDWVGLYESSTDSDGNYIGGAWQWVSNGTYFDTTAFVKVGYQARYLVWDANKGKYVSVARTPAFPNIKVESVSTAYPRKPTSSEWDFLKRTFPSLTQDDVWVTGPATSDFQYNCIAWSLGYDDRWIDPFSPLSSFQSQYQSYGYKSVGRLAMVGSIDGWGTSVDNCTHGSKIYTGTGGKASEWESKLGPNIRITHDRQGLHGTNYGQVLDSFQLSFNVTPSARLSMANQTLWSVDDADKLQKAIAAVPEDQRNAFEAAFDAWEASWSRGALAFSSDTKDRAQGEEYEALVAMGPGILPLLVEKLRDPSKFIALVLYDALQSKDELVINYANEKDVNVLLEGEQMRAQRTIRLWLDSQ